jgi:hypothetical protein
MRLKTIKWFYIPWVLFLFLIAVVLTFLDIIFGKKYPITSR